MANRFQHKTRLWVYRYLVLRDGNKCQHCGKIPAALNEKPTARKPAFLEIDHIDGNKRNDEPTNLQLLCKTCNVIKENKGRAGRESPSAMREREMREGQPATRIARELVNYMEEAPATMQANFLYEMTFRQWLLDKIAKHGSFLKQDAIDAGAEVIGCSPVTTKRYLDKLTSAAGVLQETRDMIGGTYLIFKPGYRKDGVND